jgi:hypothetical protein
MRANAVCWLATRCAAPSTPTRARQESPPDVGGQLFWGEWNSKEAADWFALAGAAPQDAEVLRSYAWFALADDRIDAALEAMNAALAGRR